MTWRDAASELGVPERTLRHWRHTPRPSLGRRGRPTMQVPLAVRNEVIRFLHRVSGPAVGLPALRALFPKVPPSVLEDLVRRYRRVWRRRYRRTGYRLEWHQPGRVWAMDHSRASQLIDGEYRQIFAVRDLASREQLAWLPVHSTGLDEVLPILRALFDEHGPPLVLKSDNGSAFRAETTTEWLLADSVVQLFSPAGYPQYNGQLERSNAVNKTFTHQRAVVEGHPHSWTAEDLEYARTLSNAIARPWGHTGPTPDEAWQARTAITDEERSRFAAEVAAQRARLTTERNVPAAPTAEEADDLERAAVSAALESCGYLTKQQVRRAPRPRKRRRRESLERRLRQFREQAGAASDDAVVDNAQVDDARIDNTTIDNAMVNNATLDDAMNEAAMTDDAMVTPSATGKAAIDKPAIADAQANDSCVANAALDGAAVDQPSLAAVEPIAVVDRGALAKSTEPSCRELTPWRIERQPAAPLLDCPAHVDTMQTAPAPSGPRLDTGPPDATAHRERSTLPWWRRPITLLLNLTKAAKISH